MTADKDKYLYPKRHKCKIARGHNVLSIAPADLKRGLNMGDLARFNNFAFMEAGLFLMSSLIIPKSWR